MTRTEFLERWPQGYMERSDYDAFERDLDALLGGTEAFARGYRDGVAATGRDHADRAERLEKALRDIAGRVGPKSEHWAVAERDGCDCVVCVARAALSEEPDPDLPIHQEPTKLLRARKLKAPAAPSPVAWTMCECGHPLSLHEGDKRAPMPCMADREGFAGMHNGWCGCDVFRPRSIEGGGA